MHGVHFPLLGNEYLLLNEFEGRAVNYLPRFFHFSCCKLLTSVALNYLPRFFHFSLWPECEALGHELKWKNKVLYLTFRTEKTRSLKCFYTSWKLNRTGKHTTKSSGPHFKKWTAKETYHSAHIKKIVSIGGKDQNFYLFLVENHV